MIQKRFDELQPYLRGIKIADNYNIIEAHLKDTWKIGTLPDNVEIQSKTLEKGGFKYHLVYSTELTFDNLIDLLEDIINSNIELEQKQALLKNKVDELKRMFEDKSLDELKNLKFSSDIDMTLNVRKPEAPASQVIKEGEKPSNHVTTEKV